MSDTRSPGPDATGPIMPKPAATGPVVPGLEFVFSINALIDPPLSAGSAPHGTRLHIPITGGTVTGPRLTGRVVPGGSDWPIITPDGKSLIEAHYTILATDGTPIYVVNKGLRVSSEAVRQRLINAEDVSPEDYYMRAAPVFDAPDGPHRWLSENIFICSLKPGGGGVLIDVYRVS